MSSIKYAFQPLAFLTAEWFGEVGCCDGGSLWNSFGDFVSRAGEVHQLEVVRLGCLSEESMEFVK